MRHLRGLSRNPLHAAAVPALIVLLFAAAAVGQTSRSKPVRRATPPAAWDKATAGTFFDDAFGVLQGERPDFGNAPRAAAAVAGGPSAAAPAAQAGSGGFKWSTLASEETLTDEIKDQKAVVAEAVARPSDFKGGGYDKARVSFSAIALAFGVIAAHDQDVRWKKDAALARDLFARAGFNCKVGTDQSFAESKARVADLESMLEGGAPAGTSDRDEDFLWSQVAARPGLMTRLETAEAALAAATASKEGFGGQLEKVVHETEIMAAIGEVIQQKDFEYYDDDSYRGHAAAMRDAAVAAREAARKRDYDAARTAVGQLKKSCDACHGEYRS